MTRRAWVAYFGVFGALIALSISYGVWRESTLEPFTAVIDLSRTERRTFQVSGFFPSDYHFGLRVNLPEGVSPEAFWFSDEQDTKVWGPTPPILDVEVADASGKTLLRERSAIVEDEGWVFSGAIHGSLVEIYKFQEFRAKLLAPYTVSVTVLRPSQTVRRGEAFLSVVKAYVLLPNALLTVGLISLMILGLPFMALVTWARKRHRT